VSVEGNGDETCGHACTLDVIRCAGHLDFRPAGGWSRRPGTEAPRPPDPVLAQ
jgi:hypothetical protein